jgi:hypothetical protein
MQPGEKPVFFSVTARKLRSVAERTPEIAKDLCDMADQLERAAKDRMNGDAQQPGTIPAGS